MFAVYHSDSLCAWGGELYSPPIVKEAGELTTMLTVNTQLTQTM